MFSHHVTEYIIGKGVILVLRADITLLNRGLETIALYK